MSTSEYQQRIASMVAAAKAEAPSIALRMAQGGLTLVKERSIRDGIQVDGSFAEYSQKQVYKSSLKKKALNASGSQYANSGGKGTYGGLRGAQGMKTDHVNLSYTNRTWTAIRPVSQTEENYRYSVLIGTSDEETSRILLYNLRRYGNFLQHTEREEQLLAMDVAADLTDLIQQYL